MLGAALAGCSDMYYDRRETVVLHAGDAMASNRVTHTIDPWSRASANRNIAFNGEKMQTAVERYRTGRIIAPVNATTSSVAYSQAAQAAQSASNSQASAAGSNGKP
jgi:hypothetical protein